MKMTRRSLGKIAATGALAAAPAVPQVAPAPDPDALKRGARESYQASAQTLAAVKLPRSTEPAMRFEA